MRNTSNNYISIRLTSREFNATFGLTTLMMVRPASTIEFPRVLQMAAYRTNVCCIDLELYSASPAVQTKEGEDESKSWHKNLAESSILSVLSAAVAPGGRWKGI